MMAHVIFIGEHFQFVQNKFLLAIRIGLQYYNQARSLRKLQPSLVSKIKHVFLELFF